MSSMPHMMWTEIHQQPQAIMDTVAAEGERVVQLAERLRAEGIHHVLLVARGTSDNAATYARYLFGVVNGVLVTSVASSLFTVYHAKLDLRDTMVLGISQSGAATDVMDVLDSARRAGAFTAALTNTEDSPISRVVEMTLLTHAQEEKALPATKTYTTALAVLHQLSAHWANDPQMAATIDRVPDLMEEVFALERQVQLRSERYRFMQSCSVIGRGLNFCTAQETALKLAECALVVPGAYSAADFMHGPIATARSEAPCILIAPSGEALGSMLELATTLQRQGAETLMITDEPSLLDMGPVSFELPSGVPEALTPLVAAVAGQLLAYYVAVHKGLNPDHPPGLHKRTLTI